MSLTGALPPARIVVIFSDLHEAELLVVIGADPFGGINRALLERRVNIAGCDLLRRSADLRDDSAGKTPNPEFEALEVFGRLDLLAEPASHLRAGAAGRKYVTVWFLQEIVEHVLAAAEQQPRDMLASVEPERQRGAERERRVLAPIIVQRGVAHLDGAVRDRVEHLQAGYQFAGAE